MRTDVIMPRMGADMVEGKLVCWLKREGEAVRKGEAIAEIETDKANLEVEAPAAGLLQRIVAHEGETVAVGASIGVIAAVDDIALPAVAAPQPPRSAAPRPVAAAHGGTSTSVTTGAGSGVAGGGGADTRGGGVRIKASPLARRLARDHGLDLAAVPGTGPGGRVTRDDVLGLAHIDHLTAVSRPSVEAPSHVAPALSAPPAPPAPPAPLPPSVGVDSSTAPALTRLQQTVARRMVESKMSAPHFYLTIEVDMTAALALRAQLNAESMDESKISVNDLVVKAVAKALDKFPILNASFAHDTLLMHDEISIAVAVATLAGLVTPVVRHADRQTLGEIAHTTHALAQRARDGKGRADDYEGATFTISNLGMFGIDTFIAIINPPQAGILAIGAVRRVPVYVGDDLVPRERVALTLSADHRVTDGATGAHFLAEVRGLLERPLRLVI